MFVKNKYSFVKKMSVRIFVGRINRWHKISSVKKIVGKKICHWQKIRHFLPTCFSSDKVVSNDHVYTHKRFWLEIPSLRKFGSIHQNCPLIWNLVHRPIQICRIQWCSLFPFLTGNTLFGQTLSEKSKLFV